MVVAEYLTDLLLFDLFFGVVGGQFVFAAVGGGEGHVVDEFVDALAIGVVEDSADYAL